MITISQLVPSVADLLQLEVEELAGVLLVHLNSLREGDITAMQHGKISPNNLLGAWHRTPEYGGERKEEVRRALMEAWTWLESEAFLVAFEPGDGWFFLSRRAQRLKSREALDAYHKANLLPRAHLHPAIASRVYPAFLRGEYDTAIFQAFREVEVAVRQRGGYGQELVGDRLMRAAFSPAKNSSSAGPLADTRLPAGEQEAMAHLFAGAFGVYRNSTGHRHVPTDAGNAAEVIGFASQLLRIVDAAGM